MHQVLFAFAAEQFIAHISLLKRVCHLGSFANDEVEEQGVKLLPGSYTWQGMAPVFETCSSTVGSGFLSLTPGKTRLQAACLFRPHLHSSLCTVSPQPKVLVLALTALPIFRRFSICNPSWRTFLIFLEPVHIWWVSVRCCLQAMSWALGQSSGKAAWGSSALWKPPSHAWERMEAKERETD